MAHRIVGPAAAAAALAADGDEVTWVDLNEEAHSLNVAHDSEAPLALLESSASAALRAALEEAAELRRQHETFNADHGGEPGVRHPGGRGDEGARSR